MYHERDSMNDSLGDAIERYAEETNAIGERLARQVEAIGERHKVLAELQELERYAGSAD
jgi:hypothetical protein